MYLNIFTRFVLKAALATMPLQQLLVQPYLCVTFHLFWKNLPLNVTLNRQNCAFVDKKMQPQSIIFINRVTGCRYMPTFQKCNELIETDSVIREVMILFWHITYIKMCSTFLNCRHNYRKLYYGSQMQNLCVNNLFQLPLAP